MNNYQPEEEVTKADFKELYLQYASEESGWTASYWEAFFENEVGCRYFIIRPASKEEHRMFIRSGSGQHCIYFLTEEGEESFFFNR